ncbi:hypothetical protein Egran_01852 [Elaphomyces granulatus]|uniref:Uncharacterized protein n=1 Tax=Elaphomyces granulatus TaxID=519963 RepID=A0A232M1X0_9EURO|nr:hypothetical protein Egran_01852 [Elaphomyces granulatus]
MLSGFGSVTDIERLLKTDNVVFVICPPYRDWFDQPILKLCPLALKVCIYIYLTGPSAIIWFSIPRGVLICCTQMCSKDSKEMFLIVIFNTSTSKLV